MDHEETKKESNEELGDYCVVCGGADFVATDKTIIVTSDFSVTNEVSICIDCGAEYFTPEQMDDILNKIFDHFDSYFAEDDEND